MTNYHTHTTFCDGKDTPEAMVLAALEKGFTALGFSSHADMVKDSAAYIAEINRLKKKYEGRIRILCGMEAEFAKDIVYPKELDYLIGSFHYLTAPDGVIVDVDNSPQKLEEGIRLHFGGDAVAYVKAYFAAEREIAKTRDYTFLAHPDLVRKFNRKNPYFDETADWYRGELEATADAIAAGGRLVEVNTGAISRGWLNDAYPSSEFRALLRARGVRFVLSSDAHAASALDTAFDREDFKEAFVDSFTLKRRKKQLLHFP